MKQNLPYLFPTTDSFMILEVKKKKKKKKEKCCEKFKKKGKGCCKSCPISWG